jgi:hypothetical protein
MLYRQPSFSIVSSLRAGLARIAGQAAEFHRTSTDTAYVDGLNEHALRDLGIRRISGRDEHFYR